MTYEKLLTLPISKNRLGEVKKNWRVVAAAHRNIDNGMVVVGARHFDLCIRSQIFAIAGNDISKCLDTEQWGDLDCPKDWAHSAQGFIDNYGEFIPRREAWYIADHAGQIINQDRYGCVGFLYSENLY